MAGVPNADKSTDSHGGQIEVMQPQAGGHLKPPETRRHKEGGTLGAFGGRAALLTPDTFTLYSWPPELRISCFKLPGMC